ncbi:hypothetical protein PF005_g10776 [Phytophthora fragariae]|uniref:Secreted protein n=2 Tax=Phytophthora TaxID=4783 RepID=A0A6A3F5E9_9STRA|nr:hypothetical protein PF003_g7602 [Phytophthora fragariae]KAE9035950.1 hypothetical protein PR002_g7314 [Phytophthora rubi]KAE8937348.1 hypothetical protein PF009_g12756 [Phytophthora fragariae]KAE9008370.1 hypothetical protein PF011_g10734 [Phytophthora fragariae]KAE9046198.1 hypothetical protein PR001_g4669 [Phytophthora rubi]
MIFFCFASPWAWLSSFSFANEVKTGTGGRSGSVPSTRYVLLRSIIRLCKTKQLTIIRDTFVGVFCCTFPSKTR